MISALDHLAIRDSLRHQLATGGGIIGGSTKSAAGARNYSRLELDMSKIQRRVDRYCAKHTPNPCTTRKARAGEVEAIDRLIAQKGQKQIKPNLVFGSRIH